MVKHRAEVLAWLAAADAGSQHLRELAARGPTFEDLAGQWLDGVEQGRIRLEWPDVLDGDDIASRVVVRRSKSEAGTQRRPPIADNLREVLAEA